jgi:hypothetical protein
MRDELNQYELIDKYLNNQLSEKDLLDFTDRMTKDPSLVEEINAQRLVNEMAFDQGLLEVKRKLKLLDAGSGTFLRRRWIIYSGVMLLLTATVTSYVLNTKQADPIKGTVVPQTNEPPSTVQKEEISKPKKSQQIHTLAPHNNSETESVSVQQTVIEIPHDEQIATEEQSVKDKPVAEEHNSVRESKEHQVHNQNVLCTLNVTSISITTVQSCADSPTGKILIDKRSMSGDAPYEFSLNQGSYFKDFVFYNLNAGTYHLSVKDANGCVWNDPREYIIEEKDCRTHEFSFSPTKGEVWKFPIDNTTNGKIEIYNRNGGLVYESEIVNGEPDQWNGTSDGDPLPMGSYIFILRNGKATSSGTVTIFR